MDLSSQTLSQKEERGLILRTLVLRVRGSFPAAEPPVGDSTGAPSDMADTPETEAEEVMLRTP